MKKLLCILLSLALLAGCAAAPEETTGPAQSAEVTIRLSGGGAEFPADSGISTSEEAAYTQVRITEPGTYRITGTLSAGQIAVDLGEEAKNDPDAAVLLILDGAEITCREAPAILFSNVYESGQPDGPAGAHILLAQGSENRVVGSHTEDFDGAVYSRMSMKLDGTGSLRIEGDNEGLCSELHLTIDGGELAIESGNDGINANADGESVITVNGGALHITVTGSTGEGDGIDSNGSIVINGGIVRAYACANSGDFGLDADLGVQIHGGTVIATGNMPERIGGSQTHALFSFAEKQQDFSFALKDQTGEAVLEGLASNGFTNLLLSSPELIEGTYTLWSGDTQYEGVAGLGGGFFGGQPIERPDWPGRDDGDVQIPPQPTMPIVTQGTVQPPTGEQPENMPVPPMPEDGGEMPTPPIPEDSENMPMPQPPAGVEPPQGSKQPVQVITGTLSTDFPIREGANYFTNLRPMA